MRVGGGQRLLLQEQSHGTELLIWPTAGRRTASAAAALLGD